MARNEGAGLALNHKGASTIFQVKREFNQRWQVEYPWCFASKGTSIECVNDLQKGGAEQYVSTLENGGVPYRTSIEWVNDLQKDGAEQYVSTLENGGVPYRTSIECVNDLQKGGAEQYVSTLENGGVPYRECKHTQGPYQQHSDLAASDGKSIFASILANNRQSMLWSHASFKRDLSMLSPQEEDYLYQNSDLLASFEVQDYVKKRDAKHMASDEEGLPEDACEDNEGKPLPQQSNFPMNEEVVSEFGDVESVENNCRRVLEKLEMGHFNDARRSWSSNDSEDLNLQHHPDDILDGFDALMIKGYAKAKREHPHRKRKGSMSPVKNATMPPAETARPSNVLVCQRVDDKAPVNRSQKINTMEVMPHEGSVSMPVLVESTRSIKRLQDKEMLEKGLTESNVMLVELDTEALRQEIFELRRENGNLGKLLKERQQKLDNFSNERILWEQKKLAEMSTFNAFKESETQRLKRERAKLEKQTKLLAQLPSKKERNEIEELKSKIANLVSEHTKKDSLQNLTINRLRRTITDLTEQIEALQEEVRRYERFLHSELDSNEDSRRKVNIQRVSATDKEHDDHDKQKTASSWNRVSTAMHWTRA